MCKKIYIVCPFVPAKQRKTAVKLFPISVEKEDVVPQTWVVRTLCIVERICVLGSCVVHFVSKCTTQVKESKVKELCMCHRRYEVG